MSLLRLARIFMLAMHGAAHALSGIGDARNARCWLAAQQRGLEIAELASILAASTFRDGDFDGI
ncbi:hypothetical protein [Cupriavidus sp. UYPR2.512]|uniref:hypothetical protein n=1 Tax=Cupriavidus sp. UYPR2.512 TaxID=1080187 RepID=UPI0012FBFE75|nr:hypothetical protein [Cupriavidus sp. UYPR2.512]